MFKKKSLALLVSLTLLLCVAVGTTLAYLIDTTDPVVNLFTPSEVTTEVDETLEGNIKKDVKIVNTGDTTAFIRAFYIVTWQNEEGEIYGVAPIERTNYTVTGKGTNWLVGNDGFYYWPSPVAPDGLTGNLIDSIQPVGACPDETYTLHVEIIGSGIQSKPKEAFDAWASGSGIKWGEATLTK